MDLYIMRHADALRVGGTIQQDAERPLSPRGEDDAALVAKSLSRLEPSIGVVLTSPLLRAVQTGTIARAALGKNVVQRSSENLSPGFRPGPLLEEIAATGEHGAVLCIGHEPDLSRFIASRIAESGRVIVAMPAAAVAHLRFATNDLTEEAALQGLLTPELIRSLQP